MRGLTFIGVGLAMLSAVETARAQTVTTTTQTLGCPAGQAVQGVDFNTRRLVCVSVVSSAQLAALQSQLNSAISALQAALGAETTARQAADSALQTALAALQTGNALAQALLPHVSVVQGPLNGVAGPHIVFERANVHIRSGSGATDDHGALTGLGNLFLGYNEPRFPSDTSNRTGAHNLIVGPEHQYPASGGFLAGVSNTASGTSASVSGGAFNIAGGLRASVSGGFVNTASGNAASVSGGGANTASGSTASISGGVGNTADGTSASVSGGGGGIAGGGYASVGGGFYNTASSGYASVSGGSIRTATGIDDWAAGALFQDE